MIAVPINAPVQDEELEMSDSLNRTSKLGGSAGTGTAAADADRAETDPAFSPASPLGLAASEEKVNEKMSAEFTQQGETRLTFHHVTYSVIDRKQNRHQILRGVSGSLKSGELCGVIGASGCGKTTLLDFLADRLRTGERSGQVFVNGQARDASYKHLASYVPQEDNLYGTMSVFETLNFSANLSLPDTLSKEDKEVRVRHLMSDLGLLSCANTRIGNVFLKGVSGGQKRRVSIGIELITNSKLLFLDEPTSGLDASAAFQIMSLLKKYANSNHVVMATIHQPSSSVFALLDKVMLLSAGRVVFMGAPSEVVPHFSRLNFKCPTFTNPADFLIDLANTDFVLDWETAQKQVQTLIDGYEQSQPKLLLNHQLSELNLAAESGEALSESLDYNVGYWKQFVELCKRNILDNVRNPGIFWVRLVMYVLLCLMVGTMYLRIGHGQTATQDRISILFFINAFLVFMSVAVVPAFISERTVFVRERANGWYSVAAYVLANSICVLPGIFLIALVSSAIVYPMIGLNTESGRFGLFLLNLFLALVTAESLMIFISSLVPHYIIGIALGAGVYGMFMLCEGFFILLKNLPNYWIWGYYIAFHSYSFQFFMWTEFNGASVDCDQQKCLWSNGQNVLDYYDMGSVNIGKDIGVLIGMSILYRFFFYLVLKKLHTGKR